MYLSVNYILESSKVQGPGDRFTIWVQGCSIHCLSCSNKDTWPFDSSKNIPVRELVERILASKSTGLTITGGEPLDQFEPVYELAVAVHNHKNVFLCSGYTFENIEKSSQKREILKVIDIICSGPFNESQVCEAEWKGSLNQEVIPLTKNGKELLKLPVFKREYRIDKKTGATIVTGFTPQVF